MQLQTLIIRNKGNKSTWPCRNSLKYHFGIDEVVSLKELFSNNAECTSKTMGLSSRCHCACSDGLCSDMGVLYTQLRVSSFGNHHFVGLTRENE